MFRLQLKTQVGPVSFKSISASSALSLINESSNIIDYKIIDNNTNEEVALEYLECLAVKEK